MTESLTTFTVCYNGDIDDDINDIEERIVLRKVSQSNYQ